MNINDLLNKPSSKYIIMVIAVNCLLAVVSFAKDVYMAAYLGTSAIADTFLLSFFIVDTLGNNLMAVALGVAVIPVFSEVFLYKNKREPEALIAGAVLYTVIVGVVITAILFINRTTIIGFLGSGLSMEMQELGIKLLTIIIPVLIFFPLNTLGMAVLQVNNRFVSSTAGPVVFNTLLFLGLVFLYQKGVFLDKGVYWLSVFLGLAVIGQFIFIWYFVIKKCGIVPDFKKLNKSRNDLIAVWKNLLPYFLVLGSTQIIYTFERYLATGLETGTLAALNYAFRLVQFPIWVFIAAIATVAFPEISRKALSQDKKSFSESVYKYLFVGALFTVPLTIILYVLRYPIIKTLFERGEFNSHSVEITATILSGYVFCIVWQGFSALLIRVSMLKGSKTIPLKAALLYMSINLFLVWYLVHSIGPVGIGYAAAGGTFVNALVLYLLLRKYLTDISRYLYSLIPFFGANIVLLFTCFGVKDFWFSVENGSEIMKFAYLALIGIICVGVYIICYLVIRKITPRNTNP